MANYLSDIIEKRFQTTGLFVPQPPNQEQKGKIESKYPSDAQLSDALQKVGRLTGGSPVGGFDPSMGITQGPTSLLPYAPTGNYPTGNYPTGKYISDVRPLPTITSMPSRSLKNLAMITGLYDDRNPWVENTPPGRPPKRPVGGVEIGGKYVDTWIGEGGLGDYGIYNPPIIQEPDLTKMEVGRPCRPGEWCGEGGGKGGIKPGKKFGKKYNW